MASSLTTYGKDQHASVYRGVALVPPANWFLCLLTADPGIAGSTASEVSTSGTGYARKSVAASSGQWDAIVSAANNGRMTQNTLQQIFGTLTATWGAITYVGMMDASSGGNMWHRFQITGGPYTPVVGTQVYLDPGDIQIIFDEA